MTRTTTAPRTITLGHSPDPDDAFMFYALARDRIDTGPYRFEHRLADIESLNRQALAGELDVTAVSYHAYPRIADRYALLSCGSSMGDGYGPLVVSRHQGPEDWLWRRPTIAIPGELTSAHLALRIYADEHARTEERPAPELATRVVAFDDIPRAVLDGEVELGLLIHEGQLTYGDEGLVKIEDLGGWWTSRTNLPLPLGANAIRRALGPQAMRDVARLLESSVAYAIEHRDEAVRHAMEFGRGLDRARTDRFVGMYVNQLTIDLGERGRRAVELFLSRGRELGMITEEVPLDFVSGAADD
jgi:1,4-dihydroxy-6-naphthoate synthase